MNAAKRLVDLAISVPALVLLFPVLLVSAVLILLFMGRPVLFRQPRLGWKECCFTVCKFRTMTHAKDSDGKLLPDSDRLTRLGCWLRRSGIDELPQLLNVIQGTMSLVGPRPLLTRYAPYFSDEERLRFSVRPGITGLALISGRNDLPWDERIAADVQYVREWSLCLDVRILLRTIAYVALGRGMRLAPDTSMPDLDEERRRRKQGESCEP